MQEHLSGKKKSGQQFSNFYNFMSELTKRLKQRIKTKGRSIKFRRPKEMVVRKREEPQESEIMEIVIECKDETIIKRDSEEEAEDIELKEDIPMPEEEED